MPETTLNAVADHGQIPADSVHGSYEESQAVLDELAGLGLRATAVACRRPSAHRTW